jgi:SAM-dependent methyltransferase
MYGAPTTPQRRYKTMRERGLQIEYQYAGELALRTLANTMQSLPQSSAVRVVDLAGVDDFALQLKSASASFGFQSDTVFEVLQNHKAPPIKLGSLRGTADAVFYNFADLSAITKKDLEARFKQAARLLKPEGLFVFVTQNPVARPGKNEVFERAVQLATGNEHIPQFMLTKFSWTVYDASPDRKPVVDRVRGLSKLEEILLLSGLGTVAYTMGDVTKTLLTAKPATQPEITPYTPYLAITTRLLRSR